MHNIVERFEGKIGDRGGNINWAYIHRRYNKATDEVAGIAAKMVGDLDRSLRDQYMMSDRITFEVPPLNEQH